MLPLSKKGKVLDNKEGKKELYTNVAKIYGKNKSGLAE
jgi:hypothetical protein